MSQSNPRAEQCIAQGCTMNSKSPSNNVPGTFPTHVMFGKGAELWASGKDGPVDKRNFIDYMCGLGASLFGYGAPEITDAICSSLSVGISHSLPTHFEIESAEALKTMFSWVDCWKFTCTGTEACMAAVRIARASTGRQKVLSEGYHGWSDMFASMTPRAAGIPEDPSISSLETPDQITDETAAVIVEPVMIDYSDGRRAWLEAIRARCTETKTVLIFDEIITGFRFKSHSVSAAWGIMPDLICLGLAMAGGLPLSAVGGSYGIMNGAPYFVSGTFAGHIAGHMAAKATVTLLLAKRRYDVDRLWDAGSRWLEKFNDLAPDIVKIKGYPTRGVLMGKPENISLFRQEACRAGILFGQSWFYNFPLIEYEDHVISTCQDILGRIRRKEVSLNGETPQSPLDMKARLLA